MAVVGVGGVDLRLRVVVISGMGGHGFPARRIHRLALGGGSGGGLYGGIDCGRRQAAYAVRAARASRLGTGVRRLYRLCSFVQQFLLQGYFLFRFLRLLPRRESVAVAAATIFAAAHVPNPILTPITLVWGMVACFVFLRCRNLYPLMMAHAILGISVSITVPGPVIHNMRVGIGYLRYHPPLTLAWVRRSLHRGARLNRPEQPNVEQYKQQPAHGEFEPHRRVRGREKTLQAAGDHQQRNDPGDQPRCLDAAARDRIPPAQRAGETAWRGPAGTPRPPAMRIDGSSSEPCGATKLHSASDMPY